MTDRPADITARKAAPWHRHLAVAFSLCFPGLGEIYLGLLDDTAFSRWRAFTALLFPAVLIVWLATNQSVGLQGWLIAGAIWIAVTAICAAISIPKILRVDLSRCKPGSLTALILPGAWIALVIFNFMLLNPWSGLTVKIAPANTSVLLPSGTSYFAVAYDESRSILVRGQLIAYRDGMDERIARVIAMPGDIFQPAAGGFYLNGGRYELGRRDGSFRSLHDLVDQLSGGRSYYDTISLSEFVGALSDIDLKRVIVVKWGDVLIADDQALLGKADQPLRPRLIDRDAIVALPISAVWSVDMPGQFSKLAQPMIAFDR